MEIIAHKTPIGHNKEVGYEPGREGALLGGRVFAFTLICILSFTNNQPPFQMSEKEYFNNLSI
jgi:hypothetical protein